MDRKYAILEWKKKKNPIPIMNVISLIGPKKKRISKKEVKGGAQRKQIKDSFKAKLD